jgi:para-nitrobenzyl esterase
MVWIHGGAFVAGSGSTYDPTPLVTGGDAVVVTINYRLGLLGALALPGLDPEAGAAGSGAYSLLDQQAALRWVQRNIKAFGGDSGRVTLFGESAGATYTCLNMVSPSAAGLMDAAIAQSGCGLPAAPKPQAERFGTALAGQLGCVTGGAADLACLRSKSPAEVNAAATTVGGGAAALQRASIPAVGGGALPLTFQDALRAGKFNRVPMIQGSNQQEGRGFVYTGAYGPVPQTEQEYLRSLGTVLGQSGRTPEQIAAEYPFSAYPSGAEALSAALGDSSFSCRALWVDGLAAGRTPVYAYEFTDPNAPSLIPTVSPGPTHAAELAYLFAMPGTALLSPAQRTLSDQMIDYWTGFAARGNPNRSGSPVWPGHAEGNRLQNLAPGAVAPVTIASVHNDHHCDFWEPTYS